MKYLLILLLALATFACGDAEQVAAEQAAEEARIATQNKLYEAMMDGHDRVMPMMGQVTGLQKTIVDRLTDASLPEEQRDLLKAAAEQLEDANDGMMEWMSGIKPLDELREDMNGEAIVEYIKEETRKIASVEADITGSMATANQLLGMESHDHDHGDGHDHDHNH